MLLNSLWNAFKFQEHPWRFKSQDFSTFDYGKSNYYGTIWSCDKGDLPCVPEILSRVWRGASSAEDTSGEAFHAGHFLRLTQGKGD